MRYDFDGRSMPSTMARLDPFHDDDELKRLGYELAVDLLAEQDTDEESEGRTLNATRFMVEHQGTFERHQAQRAV